MSHISTIVLLLSLIVSFTTQSLSLSVEKDDLIPKNIKKTGFDLKGLALISVEILQEHANDTLTFIVDLYRNVTDPSLSRFYGSCVENYGASVERFLPEAVKALGSKDYVTAKNDAAAVASYVDACDQQFSEKTPFSDRNKLVHDLSVVVSSIIGLLG
ncbi:putative invertase inhibitor [Hibiscus syriacus]|nr:putative invertase inhibitor [Hibiscus syriacus]